MRPDASDGVNVDGRRCARGLAALATAMVTRSVRGTVGCHDRILSHGYTRTSSGDPGFGRALLFAAVVTGDDAFDAVRIS